MNILEIKNLNLAFVSNKNEFKALYDINLTLEKGKTHAIVGESGCGKTITAMSVLRLLPSNAKITSGQILYKNDDILKLPEKSMQNLRGNKIALIPQDPVTSLNPLYTIGNQIIEVIKTHEKTDNETAKKQAIELLDRVKIPDAKNRLNSYPHEFSGGMCQRVIIATAIACNPEIIIADEPTTALDVTVQAGIIDLLKEIQRESGTSYIFISHNFGLVYETADEVSVMYAGHVVENAKAKNIFREAKHPYTKALLKALPNINSEELIPIFGQPPSVKDEFQGCSFAPRCGYKTDICEETPPEQYYTGTSTAACFLYGH